MDDTTITPPQTPEAVIDTGRARIDDLDRRIIALITERVDISVEIQRVRVAAGGARVQLSREMEVIARYREGLGKPGTTVALTLLELCRGRVGPRA
ncbi:chorismate mutase [Embleya scabrispora]|uniref:Chorismate mutase n=1 Tax=Embleya scabrispora TaxID=159449 RepID=A0A1T3NXG1_9ACTN|nr:chorismate mutase [Embleya scabrispora]OPC81382.1 chorismate mutase [Embleya scabrispora]